MNSQISNQNCMYGNSNQCGCSGIEIPDVSLTAGRNHTLDGMCEASNDSLEAEVLELKIQLENLQETIDEIKKSHKQCYCSLTQDYDKLVLDYNQIENNISEIQKDNCVMRSTKHSKNQKELQMVKEIDELRFFLKKNKECNDILQDKTQKEQSCGDLLKKQLCDLENVIPCKTIEMEISRCKLTDVEKTICCENVKLQELQRQNAEHEKTIKDLTSEYQELEAKLLALKEKGPVKLAAANQSLETNKVELTDACTTAADWKAKCDNAEDEYRKLETTICEEKLEAKSVLNDLCRESDRLTAQLSETSNSLSVARCDSKQLLACVRTKTNQLDELKTEREVLKKRVNQYRLQQAVQQAKIDVETKMIEDQKTLNNQRLIAIKNEIEALKQASNQREEIIKIARNELNGDCLTNRSIQRFSM